MFLKKNKLLIPFICISKRIDAETAYNEIIKKFFFEINNFSSSFIHSDASGIQEGDIYISKDKDRLMVNYKHPSNILIILAKKKAMYAQLDLEEVEYFNPKNSIASIFFSVFYDEGFFLNATFIKKQNYLEVQKTVIYEDKKLGIKLIFEINPLVLKKIEIKNDEQLINMSLVSQMFNPNFEEGFFSMINPYLK